MKINSFKKSKKIFFSKMILLVLAHVGVFVLGVAGVRAYSWSPAVKWSGTSVNYYITNVFATSFHTAIKAADATWDGAGSTFSFTYAGTTTRSAVSLAGLVGDRNNDVLYYNSGSSGHLAISSVTYRRSVISEVDTTFNTYYTFTTVGASGQHDVQSVMTHEFGHWLRLDDLSSTGSPSYCGSSSEATMCGEAMSAEDTYQRTLTTDDKNGIKAIYGTK